MILMVSPLVGIGQARPYVRWAVRALLVPTLLSADLPLPGEVSLVPRDGPPMAVVTAAQASALSGEAACELAAMIGAITGRRPELRSGDGTAGVAVGTVTEFPLLNAAIRLDANDFLHGDDHLLLSHTNGLLLIGATPTAARHAVWSFLDRLGYRRFFPAPKWEIIPRHAELRVWLDAVESPDYLNRRIWYGWGTWPENQEEYRVWCIRNRTVSAFQLNTGHAYDHILRRFKMVFDAHPEYLGLVGGERKSSKFCISNPELRALIVQYAVNAFREDPTLSSLSLDPSDGGGWCECEVCAALGPPTDRAILLANEAAEAVRRELGRGFIGLYAYNYHSPPPTRLRVHPAVIVSVATAFLKGGWTVDGLIESWREKGAALFGIREYYSVNTWDRDRPGSARGSNLKYLADTIPRYHSMGARFLSAESSENWGPNGLGYYLAARMLWSTQEVARLDERREEFLSMAFGPAREAMDRFYRLIEGSQRPRISRDLLGRLYRATADAFERAGDRADVRARIGDLVLYTRYVELYRAYSAARGDGRQAAYEALIRHAWRIRRTGMVHSYALYRDLANRDRSVAPPPGAEWNVPEAKNPWKQSSPFTEEEIRTLVEDGLRNNPTLEIEPVYWDGPLRPAAAALGFPAVPNPRWSEPIWQSRGAQTLWVWVPVAPTTLVVTVTSGLIYTERGPVQITWSYGASEIAWSLPPDRQPHPIEIAVAEAGLYRIQFADGMAATRLAWPEGLGVTFPTHMEPRYDEGSGPRWFYVPRGTRHVTGYAAGFSGTLYGPDQKPRHTWRGEDDHFTIPVGEGEDGVLWSFDGSLAKRVFHLLSVPPFFARTPQELLLPEPVILRDRPALSEPEVQPR